MNYTLNVFRQREFYDYSLGDIFIYYVVGEIEMTKRQNNKSVMKLISCCLLMYGFLSMPMLQAAENTESSADESYPDKFKILLGAYIVDDTNTEVAINSPIGNIGTTINMQRDLGADDKLSVPRLDGYYRFNDKHRLDFSWFNVAREGTKTTTFEIKVGDETFAVNDVVVSKVDTTFLKLAYGYSFYKSPKVELSFIAGLNMLDYSVVVDNQTTGRVEAADVTAPLPVFGLSMAYAISPRWLVHYKVETFYIELDNEIRGSLLNTELGVEYRLFKNMGLGLGLSRFALDAKVNTSSYSGSLADLYRGANFYVSAYF